MSTATLTRRPIALTLTLLALVVGPVSAGSVTPGTKNLSAPSELKWEPMPGLPGAQQSPLWGDPQTGEHGILYRWPAGTAAPQHTHTNSEHGVVISGTLTLAVDGAAAKTLPAGSYFSMYGGTKHATVCVAGADCVFFIHREGPFDANMTAK